ncbi:MAG TPA: flagellar biosynthesis anti-sigma factor FlgM [bacterium]|nr:flagellar biosynthesis anti-sigma factor FlgM [bacterium]
MTIDKINKIQAIQTIQNLKKVKENANVKNQSENDNITISSKAQEALELSKLVNKIAAQECLRTEKIADAKEKIASGYYLKEQVTEKVAEKIAEILI